MAIPGNPEYPARRWAARRDLWPASRPLPDAVRWIPPRGKRPGSLIAGFAPLRAWAGPKDFAPEGVQLVHIGPDDSPATDRGGLGKRSHGSMSGRVCLIGDSLPEAGRVHVAEGIADALAIAAREFGAVIAAGGTVGIPPLAAISLPVTAWPAGSGPDPAGAAERAAKRAEALEAAKDAARREAWDYVRREMEAARASDPEAEAAALADRIAEAPDIEVLARLAPPPDVLAAPAFGSRIPEAVLWRDGTDPERCALIGRGEVAVLSGPGQGGKSTVTLAVAHAARTGGTACGLQVARGRVAIASYEDPSPRLAARMEWYGPPDEWEHVREAPHPHPSGRRTPRTGEPPAPLHSTVRHAGHGLDYGNHKVNREIASALPCNADSRKNVTQGGLSA